MGKIKWTWYDWKAPIAFALGTLFTVFGSLGLMDWKDDANHIFFITLSFLALCGVIGLCLSTLPDQINKEDN
jgi:hypothetical protein